MEISQIRDAQPGQTIWDDKVKGLHLRVTATGAKSFFAYYRTKAGQQRRPKIGAFGDITLADARRRAKEILDKAAVGADLKGDWDVAKAELTVHELFNRTRDEYWDSERFRKSDRLRDVKSLYGSHIESKLGGLKLSALDVIRVRAWHRELSATTPTAANRALEVLSRMFSYAEEIGIRTQGTNPCLLVRSNQEKKRKRFATEDEIKEIGLRLNREYKEHPRAVVFLYLLLMTGSRPRAIERAKADQLQALQLEGRTYGVLTFEGKTTESTGEEEVVIIPPQLMEMIASLPKSDDGRLVGCGMPVKMWRKIRGEINAPDLWARDLRRTFATVGLSNGVEIGKISELLNHKSTQTTKIYAKLMDNKRVQATLKIADTIELLVRPHETSDFGVPTDAGVQLGADIH